MGDQLVEFLRGRKQRESGQGIDWPAKLGKWADAVGELYAYVEEMLRDSVESKDVAIRRYDTEVTEEFIGTYSIPVLQLTVGAERVEFRPKGFTVIGAAGRVDVRGERDVVTLIKATQGGGWLVVLQRVPALRTAPLDRETLKDVLERVMLPLS